MEGASCQDLASLGGATTHYDISAARDDCYSGSEGRGAALRKLFDFSGVDTGLVPSSSKLIDAETTATPEEWLQAAVMRPLFVP